MNVRMYECGFGDCFRLREDNQVDLYIDFGIHASSWKGIEKVKRFDQIISDMGEKKDFLLTHYHDDHFNGVIYMAANSEHRFENVYISDVWDMPESVQVTGLTLLREIFTRSVISENNTIINFLKSICTRHSRIYFISRNIKFHNNQYIALWPKKDYVAKKALEIFEKLQDKLNKKILKEIISIASQLNSIVLSYSRDGVMENYETQFTELQERLLKVQTEFEKLYKGNYDNNIQYKLTKFGNYISIVFQNCHQGNRNVIFTGDFGKKRNWSFIEKNRDNNVEMHPHYDIVKVPHHGTNSYYHSFRRRIDGMSTLMIPNGYGNSRWNISPNYNRDSIVVKNKTVCAYNKKCFGVVCPNCTYIYPKFYLDI